MIYLMLLYSLSTLPLTKALLIYMQPFFLVGLRMSCAGTLLLGYMRLKGSLNVSKAQYGVYAKIIMFAVFVPYVLRYYGLHYGAALRADLLYNVGPLVTYFLAPCWTPEKIQWPRTCALLLGCIGMVLFLDTSLTAYCAAPLTWADGALIGSSISFCYGWAMIRTLVVDKAYAPALVNGVAMTGGGMLALLACVGIESAPYTTVKGDYWVPLLLAVVLISNVVAHNLYAILLRSYSLTLLQMGYWVSPVMVAVVQGLYMHGRVPVSSVLSCLCLLVGFLWMYRLESIFQPIPDNHIQQAQA